MNRMVAEVAEGPIAALEPVPSVFQNVNMQNALVNKIGAAVASIEAGDYRGALGRLENDILKKTDGCATTGRPDKNDWIVDPGPQRLIYPLVMELIKKAKVVLGP